MMFHAWFGGEDDYMRRLWADAGYLPSDVKMTSPADGTSYPAGKNITLSAEATDRDGTIAKVEFYALTTHSDKMKVGESTSSPFKCTWKRVAADNYTVYARAIDNKGLSGYSPMRTIKVVAQTAK
jgi:chitinase